MFENGKVYKIEVIENVMMQKVEKGNCYSLYIVGDRVKFLRPRGFKVLFQHSLKNCNYWLYEHCNIINIETIEEWKIRTA